MEMTDCQQRQVCQPGPRLTEPEKRAAADINQGHGPSRPPHQISTRCAVASGGGKGNLIPESGTTFYNGREGAPRTVTFTLGLDGKAISMTLKAPGTERTLQKLP